MLTVGAVSFGIYCRKEAQCAVQLSSGAQAGAEGCATTMMSSPMPLSRCLARSLCSINRAHAWVGTSQACCLVTPVLMLPAWAGSCDLPQRHTCKSKGCHP